MRRWSSRKTLTGVFRPESIPIKRSGVKSFERGSGPSAASQASLLRTMRTLPNCRASAKASRVPSEKRNTTCVCGCSFCRPACTRSRPVIRKPITSERPDESRTTAYLPRRSTPRIRSPRSDLRKSVPSGATAIFASVTSTARIVLPTTCARSPRTIVSTSGSSGRKIPDPRPHANAVDSRFSGRQLDHVHRAALPARDAVVRQLRINGWNAR